MKAKLQHYHARLLLICILFVGFGGLHGQTYILAHHYDFRTGSGTTITDNNNSAYQQTNGTLTGTISYSNGGVTVASSTTSNTYGYVAFDGTKFGKTSTTTGLSGYTNGLTFEAYIQAGNATNASRFATAAYFGGATAGKQCIWLQTCRNDGGAISNTARLETNNNSTTANISSPEMDDNKLHHLVAVLRTDSLLYYLDGALVGRALTGASYITSIGTAAAYLFRSVYNDPNWNGTIFEFNIYDGVLTTEVVLQHAQSFFQSDASYNGLQLLSITGGGYFTSGFYPQKTDYQLILPPNATSFTLNASAYNSSATISGAVSGTGSASATIPVSSDYGTTTVTLSSQNGTYSKTYTIKYCRNLLLAASYTFSPSTINGTTVNDATGNGANATLVGSGYTVSNGVYTITTTAAGSAGTYLSLPTGTGTNQINVSSYPAITIESFIKKAAVAVTNQNYYLWYFGATGTGSTNTTKNGTQYFDQFTSKAYYNPTTRNNTANPTTWSFEQGYTFTDPSLNTVGHYVTVLENDTIRTYLNGSLVGNTWINACNYGAYANSLNTLENISSGSAYLGRSGYTADNNWCGSYGEVNIYRGAMSAAIAASRATNYLKDATLSGMVLTANPSNTSLTINFDPSTTVYNIDIPLNTTSVAVAATASKDFATMTGTGSITTNPGGATNIVVTSADGTTTKTYTLNFIPPTPVITVIQSSLSMDESTNTGTLTVNGANLSDVISFSGPSNFSFNPTTLPANSTTASVTVTYDGLAASSGNITLSSPGATSQTVSVVGASNTLCFSPLYATGNLVTDPYLNSLTAYSSSWGVGTGATINTDLTKVYCGLKSGKVTGTKAGSITYPLTGKWAVNSGYRIRAKVMVDAGTFNFNVSGWSGSSTDIVNTYTASAGVWQTVDFKFITGSTLGANQWFYFNNYTSNTAGTGYVDNIEMYNIPLISATAGTGGTVSGAGPFDVGAPVSLVATSNSGYHFVNWTESGCEVSQNATYTFSASTNRTLVANFAANAVSVTSDTNASTLINCGSCDVTVSNGTTLTVDATKIFNSVTVAPGAKLTVASGNILSTALTLQSSGTGTATFVDADPTGSPITATVQQYLPQGRNWYVGVPFTTASGVGASALTATGTGTTVSYYDEPSSSWVNNYTGILTRGVGYIAVSNPTDGSATNNMSFSGALNTGSVTAPLTRKGATKAGFNLVANPYPSYLNAMAAINANANMENTIWYRTRSASAYYFETVNTTSGVGTNNAGTGTVTGYVPPMQAFWVRTITDNNSITFTNAMRAHAGNITLTDGQTVLPTTLMKAGAVKNTQHQMLRLKVSNGTNSDETVIYTNDNASNNYDAYDSQKMTNNTSIPELFTIADNNNLVINGIGSLQPNMEIPLGFFTKEANNFSIKATQISNIDGYTIVLRDNLQQTEQALTDTTTTYSFNSGVTSSVSRFSIVFKSGSVTTGVNKPGNQFAISVYENKNGRIVIDSPFEMQNNSRATLYNSIGQVQEIAELTGSRTVLQKTSPGIYIVSVVTNGMNSINKVVIE